MYIKQNCRYCGGRDIRKHGLARSKIQRYLCKSCNKTFQNKYIYRTEITEILAKSIQLVVLKSSL